MKTAANQRELFEAKLKIYLADKTSVNLAVLIYVGHRALNLNTYTEIAEIIEKCTGDDMTAMTGVRTT